MEKLGIDDYLVSGGKVEDIPEATETDVEEAAKLNEGRALNSVKLAEFLQAKNLIFVGDSFYIWTQNLLGGGVYCKLRDTQVEQFLLRELGYKFKRAKSQEVLHILKSMQFLDVEKFNAMNRGLNLLNGVFDLEALTLRRATPRDFFSVQLPVTWQPEARSEVWREAVDKIFDGNAKDIKLFQTFCGYAVQPDTRSDKFLCVVGSGANGKSVLAKGLLEVLGKNNVTSLSLSRLGDDRFTGMLFGKMLNITTESSQRASNWSENLKTAVSGELMISDEKYKDRFMFTPFAKHVIFMNESPYMEDKSIGVSRRMILINLEQNFEKREDKDENLKARLADERDGIFNWALEGYKRWREEGFKMHEEASERVRQLKLESDSVLQFVDEMCETEEMFEQDKVERSECYKLYSAYCKETGQRSVKRSRFFKVLERDFGCDTRTKIEGKWWIRFLGYSEAGRQMIERRGSEIDRFGYDYS